MATMHNEFERIFNGLDEDGDGRISSAELCLFMSQTTGDELSLEDAKSLVESTNSEGSEMLDLEGFVRLMEGMKGGKDDEDKDMMKAFQMYDIEGTGYITANNLKRMLSRLGTKKDIEECRAMIRRFDLNGDEVLCFEEFRAMIE